MLHACEPLSVDVRRYLAFPPITGNWKWSVTCASRARLIGTFFRSVPVPVDQPCRPGPARPHFGFVFPLRRPATSAPCFRCLLRTRSLLISSAWTNRNDFAVVGFTLHRLSFIMDVARVAVDPFAVITAATQPDMISGCDHRPRASFRTITIFYFKFDRWVSILTRKQALDYVDTSMEGCYFVVDLILIMNG